MTDGRFLLIRPGRLLNHIEKIRFELSLVSVTMFHAFYYW
jgi:hypothetical protein